MNIKNCKIAILGLGYVGLPLTIEFSKKFKEYYKTGDEFLIKCCKQHISEIYGKKSPQMNKFKNEVKK